MLLTPHLRLRIHFVLTGVLFLAGIELPCRLPVMGLMPAGKFFHAPQPQRSVPRAIQENSLSDSARRFFENAASRIDLTLDGGDAGNSADLSSRRFVTAVFSHGHAVPLQVTYLNKAPPALQVITR